MSLDEVIAIADAVDPRFRAVVLTGAWAGLRFEEIQGLRRSNVILEAVDLTEPTVRVREVLVEVGGELHPQIPKTKGAIRDVPIPSGLVTALTSHIEAGFAQPDADGLLFTAHGGGPLRRSNFAARVLGPAALEATGRWMSPHDLRRSCGSMLIAAGVDPVAAAAMLGDRVETFLTHYAGLYPGSLKLAVHRFSQFLSNDDQETEAVLGGAAGGLEAAG
jgi:integrase